MFTLPPKDSEKFIEFRSVTHKLDKLLEWGLITETARKKQLIKAFEYYEMAEANLVLCDVVGYIPYNDDEDSPDTAVIRVEGKLHKIMPVYLKEMQKGVGKTSEIVLEVCSDGTGQIVLGTESTNGEVTEKKEVCNVVEKSVVKEGLANVNQIVLEEKADVSQIMREDDSHVGPVVFKVDDEVNGVMHCDKHKEYDFVAIDFETANSKMNSACSIGLVAVNHNEIVEKRYFLIKPPVLKFDAENTRVHGLTEADVANEKDFCEIWEELAPYLLDNLLVAHNAAFDMSVLRCCLKEYGIAVPDTEYVCSIPVSAYAFAEKVGKSLGERTKLLGIGLENAHHALDDAVACAELVIKTLEKNNRTSLHKFLTKNRDINVKRLIELNPMEEFKKVGSKPKAKSSDEAAKKTMNKIDDKSSRFKNNIRIADVEVTVEAIDENNPIFNKAFVFTGDMQNISRKEAMQSVVNLGGIIKSGVSKKVDYVVVGMQDADLVGMDGMSSKERKAKELMEQGVAVQIIDEEMFSKLINE